MSQELPSFHDWTVSPARSPSSITSPTSLSQSAHSPTQVTAPSRVNFAAKSSVQLTGSSNQSNRRAAVRLGSDAAQSISPSKHQHHPRPATSGMSTARTQATAAAHLVQGSSQPVKLDTPDPFTTFGDLQQGTELHDQSESGVTQLQASEAPFQVAPAEEEGQTEARPLPFSIPFSIPFSGMSASFAGQAEVCPPFINAKQSMKFHRDVSVPSCTFKFYNINHLSVGCSCKVLERLCCIWVAMLLSIRLSQNECKLVTYDMLKLNLTITKHTPPSAT